MSGDTAPGTPGARIVVFGATGYTGRLVAEALVDRGERPVLAGRDPGRLATVADAAQVDLDRAEQILQALLDGLVRDAG